MGRLTPRSLPVTVGAAAALTAGLLVAPSTSASAASAGAVIQRQATLTKHFDGLPASGSSAGQQIASAKVTQDLRTGTLSASVTLRSFPSGGAYADLVAGFGRTDSAGTCVTPPAGVFGGSTERYTGGPISFSVTRAEARSAAWNCAVVFSTPVGGSAQPYDGVFGSLSNVQATPKASIARVDPQVLKRKKWTNVRVTVTNPGTATARSIKVSGKTSGVRVKSRSFGSIAPGRSVTRNVKMRLDVKKTRTVRLAVRGSGKVKASRSMKLYPLAKATSGRWKGRTADGQVTFTVTKGTPRIKGWRGVLRTNCSGGPGGVATYSFPTTRIPKNGTVKRTKKLARGGSITLYAKITGNRVVQGKIGYNGPSSCGGASGWTAKR